MSTRAGFRAALFPAALLHAARALYAQRVRSLLALLGIVLGTSSLVLLVALLDGGRGALIEADQEASESDVVVVRAKDVPRSQQGRTRRELSRADARELSASRTLGDAWVSSERGRNTVARIAGKEKRVTLASAQPETAEVYRLHLARGRFFDPGDLEGRGHVCVIGHEVATALFAGADPLGAALRIAGDVWRVVGVLEDKPMLGNTDSTWIWNRKVLVPETSYDATYNPQRAADTLLVRPERQTPSLVPMDDLRRLVGAVLVRRHFGVQNYDLEPNAEARQAELILTILRVLLFGATAISLLVSGINVMNVMLVSVSERTVEIGIRRAVGAPPGAIGGQFAFEALLLTGAGGFIGVSLGAALAALAAFVLRRALGGWELILQPWAMLGGVAVSLLIGLTFGTYPARRAARLDIVRALRNE
jgi:putative ABC transport system permease protein